MELGEMHLGPHGKKMVAHAMFHKGKHFLAAATLLDQKQGYRDVVLHLIGQGIEIIQKGLLLARDYDKYQPQLKAIGHDLTRGSDTLTSAYGFRPVKDNVKKEMDALSALFKQHSLRYGTILDILGNSSDIPYGAVFRRAVVLTAYGNRVFKTRPVEPSGPANLASRRA